MRNWKECEMIWTYNIQHCEERIKSENDWNKFNNEKPMKTDADVWIMSSDYNISQLNEKFSVCENFDCSTNLFDNYHSFCEPSKRKQNNESFNCGYVN